MNHLAFAEEKFTMENSI